MGAMSIVPARAVVVVAGLLLGVLAAAGPAAAHTGLETAEPAADATVSAPPARVRLDFTGPLQVGADHALGLFGPDGARVDDGTAVPVGDRSIEVGVAPLAATGVHTVRYLVIAEDGHPIEGEHAFTYDGPLPEPSPEADPSVSPGAELEPSPSAGPPDAASPSPEPLDDASPVAAQGSGGGPPVILIGGLTAVLGAAGVLVLILRSRRG